MTDEARTATNQLSRLVHLPCTSRTSSRPITADAIRTEIIINSSVVGRHQWTTPKWGCASSAILNSLDEFWTNDATAIIYVSLMSAFQAACRASLIQTRLLVLNL